MNIIKYCIYTLSIFLSIYGNSQRVSIVDKDKSNEFLFDEKNPISLISMAGNFANYGPSNYNCTSRTESYYMGAEMIYHLSQREMTELLDSVLTELTFEIVVSTITGEDSLIVDPVTGHKEQKVKEVQTKLYYDLKNITRLVILEKQVVNSKTGAVNYEVDKIGFAKKYNEFGDQFFITFAVDFKDLMVANEVRLKLNLTDELTRKLCDKESNSSLLNQLKELQFERFKEDSLKGYPNRYSLNSVDFLNPEDMAYVFDEDERYDRYYEKKANKNWREELPKALSKRKITYLKDGGYLAPVASVLTGEDSLVTDPATGISTTLTELRYDSVAYWIDLDITAMSVNYKIGSDCFGDSTGKSFGAIDSKPSRIKFYSELGDPGLRYHFTVGVDYIPGNLTDDLLSLENLKLLNDFFPYSNSSEFPYVKFFDSYQKNDHTFYTANKKGKAFIKKTFYVNEYFPTADPFFKDYFLEKK
jgi:hypothetical protein